MEMSAQLRKRLAQGAGKKSKPVRSGGSGDKAPAKSCDAEESVNIHSESQRLIRGRRVYLIFIFLVNGYIYLVLIICYGKPVSNWY